MPLRNYWLQLPDPTILLRFRDVVESTSTIGQRSFIIIIFFTGAFIILWLRPSLWRLVPKIKSIEDGIPFSSFRIFRLCGF